jgi:chromosome segregation ATPase
MFSSPKKRDLEREVDRLQALLSSSAKKISESSDDFATTEKDLLLRVEKSFREQLFLKEKLTIKDNEVIDLKVTIKGLQNGSQDVKYTDNSNARAVQEERFLEQQQIQQMNNQLQHFQLRIIELETVNQEMNTKEEESIRLRTELMKKVEEIPLLNSRLHIANTSAKDLSVDKGYLTSEIQTLSVSLDTVETQLDDSEKKLLKKEKENKVLKGEKEDLSIKLRGNQRELQQLQQMVGDIKQKELWMSMEGDLQQSKKDEMKELENEELTALRTELEKVKAEFMKSRQSLQSQLSSSTTLFNEKERECDYLSAEVSTTRATLETIETEFEVNEKKLLKREKEIKSLLGERDNLSLQLRGCQRELQQLNQVMGDIKQVRVRVSRVILVWFR